MNFHDFTVFGVVVTSAHDFNYKKGRSHDYRLLKWAEVNACSTMNVHFGRFDMAETTHLLSHNLAMKNLTFARIFKGFL